MTFDVRDGNKTYKHTIDANPLADPARFVVHTHADYELLYFIRGEAEFVIEQNRYQMRPHSLLVAKPGEHHKLVMRSDRQLCERIVLRFSASDVPERVAGRLGSLATVYDIGGTRISEQLLRLDSLVGEVQDDLLADLFLSALIEVLVFLCSKKALPRLAEQVNDPVAKIIRYIDCNLVEIRQMDDLCAGLHLSRSTVYRLFYTQMHIPVMSYIRTKKCMLAHTLLTQGVPPTAAGERCGFYDYSSFYRTYRKTFGHPPSEWE